MELLIATKNAGKIRELELLLADLPITLRSLQDFPDLVAPEETGSSFAENAVLKAGYYAARTRIRALADDSGLEVAALQGAPGVFSARYGAPGASDPERARRLLDELDRTASTDRTARFVCAMALADHQGRRWYLTEGVCCGKITDNLYGTHGFGYDPIFVPDGFLQTFGELSPEVKQQISHRGRAAEKINAFLRGFIAT